MGGKNVNEFVSEPSGRRVLYHLSVEFDRQSLDSSGAITELGHRLKCVKRGSGPTRIFSSLAPLDKSQPSRVTLTWSELLTVPEPPVVETVEAGESLPVEVS